MLALLLAAALASSVAPDAGFVLKGTVLDAQGVAVASAQVVATSTDPSAAPSTQTDAKGEFTLTLDPGTYALRVTAAGFQAAEKTVTAGNAGRDAREFVLERARFAETVTVTAARDHDSTAITSATRTSTPLLDVPQSITVTGREQIRDQMMLNVGDVMRFTPGISVHQGENNRDQVIIRGNSSSADFFLDGVRDDAQYHRDLYNLDRVEALKGPNAMIFGRGGGGGVVNRVTKEAVFQPVREASVQGGGYGHQRIAADLGQPLSEKIALRLNAMYEDSDSFRDFVNLERYGVNPTLTALAGPRTRFTLGFEHLHDTRVADRGITSFQGLPADVDVSTYYGNPDDSHVRASVDLASATVEHKTDRVTIRNRTLFGAYDRFYQNYVPGVVDATKTLVTLSAYNNATERDNLFNQTDVIVPFTTGNVEHTLVAGIEVGDQNTDNFRTTGFFNDATTSIQVAYDNPTTATPVTFRQSATDADNHLDARVAAVYVQDQAELTRKIQVVAGVRFDRFELDYHDNRNGDALERVDDLVSPRAGVVYKPVAPVSVYGNYSVSYLPSSGDQFSSLTTITQQLEPEKFSSYEVGSKWEPHAGLAVSAALYRLDRTNTRSTDPNDPTRIVQTGSQRTTGFELGARGKLTDAWWIAGGYTNQKAFVTRATVTAREGALVGQVPRQTVSLWNNYQILPRLGTALGLLYRTDMFATIDNSVTLPSYTRVDVAAFYNLSKEIRIQANLENALDKKYFTNADSNTNITPGFGRTLRVALTAAF